MNNKDKNVLALAYLGDGVYEIYIRKYLIDKGIEKVKTLQEEAIKYVSAKSQCSFIMKLLENNFYNDVELEIIHRARNHKGTRHPKNTSIVTYKYSTAFEAVIGNLYLNNDIDRIKEIVKEIIGE